MPTPNSLPLLSIDQVVVYRELTLTCRCCSCRRGRSCSCGRCLSSTGAASVSEDKALNLLEFRYWVKHKITNKSFSLLGKQQGYKLIARLTSRAWLYSHFSDRPRANPVLMGADSPAAESGPLHSIRPSNFFLTLSLSPFLSTIVREPGGRNNFFHQVINTLRTYIQHSSSVHTNS